MSVKNKLISNVSYIFLNMAVATVLTTVFWIIVGKTLSPVSFGITATALQIAAFFSSVTVLGMDIANRKLLPEFLNLGENDKAQGLINFSFKVVISCSIAAAVLIVLFTPFFSSVLKLGSGIVLLIAASTFTMSLSTLYSGIHYGFQTIKRIFLSTIYGQIALIALSIALISYGFDYAGAIIAYAVCYLIYSVAMFSKKHFNITKTPVMDIRKIMKYSMPAFVVVLSTMIFNNTQFIILSSLKSFEITGLFAVAMKIILLITLVPTIFFTALFPIISALSVEKDSKGKQAYLTSLVLRYTIWSIMPLAAFMIIFSKELVLLFSTSEYLGAITFLPPLILGAAAFGLASQFFSILFAIGEPKKYRNGLIGSTAIYLVSALVLTNYFSAIGLAISYLFSSLIMLALSFIFIRKYLPIKFPMRCLGKISLATAISSAMLIFSLPFVSHIWIAGAFAIIAAIIYTGLLFKMNFYTREDAQVLEFLSERTPLFGKLIKKLGVYLATAATETYKEGHC